MSKKRKIIKNDTFNAKIDIVTNPDNIKNYSIDRKDYTELAMIAIENKSSVIQFIPSSYKEYSILCEEAINHNLENFLFIDQNVSNYRELGIRVIINNPLLVTSLAKENKYYFFFWNLAISTCYKVLMEIDEDKKRIISFN